MAATVGDERAELTFADGSAALRAATVLAVHAEGDTVSVPTDGSASAVRAVLETLAAQGIEPLTIALTKPSLDDVFLALTRPIREEIAA